MLPHRQRLQKNYQFQYIYKKGSAVSVPSVTLLYHKAKGNLRIGFSVSNKLGKAVVRNKIRRRMREAVRSLLPRIPRGYHIIFAARTPIAHCTYAEIRSNIESLLLRANLLTGVPEGNP